MNGLLFLEIKVYLFFPVPSVFQTTVSNQNKIQFTQCSTSELKSYPLPSGLYLEGTFQATPYKMPLPFLCFIFLYSTYVHLAFICGVSMKAKFCFLFHCGMPSAWDVAYLRQGFSKYLFTEWPQQAFRVHHLYAGCVPGPGTGLLSMSSQSSKQRCHSKKIKIVRVSEYKVQQSTAVRGVLSTLGCREFSERR